MTGPQGPVWCAKRIFRFAERESMSRVKLRRSSSTSPMPVRRRSLGELLAVKVGVLLAILFLPTQFSLAL
jgi:hypothetical protein